MTNKQTQNGSALIMALFIMVLVMIAAVAMATHLEISIRQTELLQNNDRLYNSLQLTKSWALNTLQQDAKQQNNGFIPDDMPQIFSPNPVNSITVAGTLNDLQAKFNINDLLIPSFAQSFSNLLVEIVPHLQTVSATEITSSIQNWLAHGNPQNDPNNPPTFNVAPSFPIVDISELRKISGVTPQIMRRISPYVTALPAQTAVNINTTSKAIIRSLGNGLSGSQAALIINLRNTLHGFTNLNQLTANPAISGLNIPNNQITITSSFFQLKSNAILNGQQLKSVAMFERVVNNNQIVVTMLNEKIN